MWSLDYNTVLVDCDHLVLLSTPPYTLTYFHCILCTHINTKLLLLLLLTLHDIIPTVKYNMMHIMYKYAQRRSAPITMMSDLGYALVDLLCSDCSIVLYNMLHNNIIMSLFRRKSVSRLLSALHNMM